MSRIGLTFVLLTAALSLTAADDVCLRTVREARDASYGDMTYPVRFDLTGTVLGFGEGTMTISEDDVGIALENFPTNDVTWKHGDIVRVRGEMTVNPEERRFLRVRRLDVLGHRDIADPVRASGDDILDGNLNYRKATVDGVIQGVREDDLDQRYNWVTLNTPQGIVMVAVPNTVFVHADLRRLVDAEVALTGLVLPAPGWRVGFAPFIGINSPANLRVLRDAPADSFKPTASSLSALHRKVFSGTVLARTANRCFVRAKSGRFIEALPSSDGTPPAPGQCVDVSGFTELDGTRLRLLEAVFRTADALSGRKDSPLPVRFERLFTSTNKIDRINTKLHGSFVRLRGRVLPTFPNGTDDGSFGVTDGTNLVLIDCSAFTSFTQPPESTLVEIDGILLAEFEPVRPSVGFPVFKDFRLVPQAPEGIRILEQPSPWTPKRLLALLSVLSLALVAVLIWNRTLNARANRRGAELAREQLAHRAAALKVEERTRLAVLVHDAISQTLTGIALLFDSAADEATTPSLRKFFAVSRQMLASCRRELKGCLWDLRTRTFEEKDMTEALRRTLQPFADEARLAIRFNVPRETLSESLAHDILCIVRELVVNALRHGHAANISIAGTRDGDEIRFAVEDDGKGFDPETAPGPRDGHFGLQGIRERIKSHDGTLDLRPGKPRGTRVSIALKT